ncbi:MAG: VOC family protein [Cyclobacteriaceae bacterium]|nr:VOC family protein [Cyclobacteriaceae bacterium]
MKALGLRTVKYSAPELDKAKAWYADLFQIQPYFDEPFYVGFNIGGYELGLDPDGSPEGNSTVTYWGVENIEEAYKDCIAKGAKEDQAPMNVGGELMVASVKDPWGNVIGLIYNPYFELP